MTEATFTNKIRIIPRDKANWQKALSEVITDPRELFELLDLDPSLLEAAYRAIKLFPLRVPRGFVSRIEKANPSDPLLRQILPLEEEFVKAKDFSDDPLQEANTNFIPGLLHKYHGRLLIVLTGSCAIHCRYCFRRYFPYEENNTGKLGFEKILAYIKADTSIKEVILSGGDPLNVSDKQLAHVVTMLATIPHLKRLRFHSRLPIVLPERITNDLVNIFVSSRLTPIMVVHANHANEIDSTVATAIEKMRSKNILVLNQTVLLKGVNDDVDSLVALSEKLFSVDILPYYLHLLDKVNGTTHFALSDKKAKQLYYELQLKLSGFLVPRLVREIAGQPAKTLIL
jgi:EF-P beta-lysylation protein EpmB